MTATAAAGEATADIGDSIKRKRFRVSLKKASADNIYSDFDFLKELGRRLPNFTGDIR